jgi:LAO/AO transport system kinase
MSRPRTSRAAASLRSPDRRSLARAITAVESGEASIDPLLRAIYPSTGKIPVVGLAGPLGVGKSSLINLLAAHLRSLGKSVGVIAVDPSSPFSGGSVLGDRIRFERRANDSGVFFRSMASRGAAGGLAGTTRDVVRLLEAAGFDVVLVETVGSGQVDVAIRAIATTRIVVLVPHLGDQVQTMKAGLFEIADVFCVNKSDLPGAEVAERDLAELASLGPAPDGWRPRVVRTSTVLPSGVPELWKAVEAHERFRASSPRYPAEVRARAEEEIVGRARDLLVGDLAARLATDPALRKLVDRVVAHEIDPRSAAERLVPGRRGAKRP